MVHVSPETFRAALRDLPDDEFAAFVAAVFRARGHDARVAAGDDRVTVAVDDRTLLVYRPNRFDRFGLRRPALGDADGVVTDATGLSLDCEVVGPDRLREYVLFGVGAVARAELLDRLPVTSATPSRFRDEPPSGLAAVRRSHLIVAVAAMALVVVALVGFPGGAQQGTGDDGSDDGSFGDRVTVFSPQGTPPSTTTTPSPESLYPLGIGENGIESGRILARTHARALSGGSYRLTIVRREFVGGNLTGFRREVTHIAGPRRLYSTLNQSGRFRGRTFVTNDREIYINGSVGYARSNGTDVWRVEISENGDDPLVDYTGGVADLLLPNNSSQGVESVRYDGTPLLRIPFATASSFSQHNVSGYVLVDDDGVVRDLRRRWELEDSNLTVVVRMRVERGNVTVDPPEWVRAHRERAANASTGENATEPA